MLKKNQNYLRITERSLPMPGSTVIVKMAGTPVICSYMMKTTAALNENCQKGCYFNNSVLHKFKVNKNNRLHTPVNSKYK